MFVVKDLSSSWLSEGADEAARSPLPGSRGSVWSLEGGTVTFLECGPGAGRRGPALTL